MSLAKCAKKNYTFFPLKRFSERGKKCLTEGSLISPLVKHILTYKFSASNKTISTRKFHWDGWFILYSSSESNAKFGSHASESNNFLKFSVTSTFKNTTLLPANTELSTTVLFKIYFLSMS